MAADPLLTTKDSTDGLAVAGEHMEMEAILDAEINSLAAVIERTHVTVPKSISFGRRNKNRIL